MADCELIEKCVFFHERMANMPGTAALTKNQLCKTDNSQCARYMIVQAIGREAVPGDLFPNEIERAQKIINELKGG